MLCSRFSTVATSAEICKIIDPLQSSHYTDNNSGTHWCQPFNKLNVVRYLLNDSGINRNWCQQYKRCQPRHPGATMRGTLEMSQGRLTWDWGDKHSRRQTHKEAEEYQRNAAFYRIKRFVEKAIGKEMALSRLPPFLLWPSTSRGRNRKKCPRLHVQRWLESFNEIDMKKAHISPNAPDTRPTDIQCLGANYGYHWPCHQYTGIIIICRKRADTPEKDA